MTIDELNSSIRADLQASERRDDHAMRAAIFRLRLAEFHALHGMVPVRAQELADAINGVVALIRK